MGRTCNLKAEAQTRAGLGHFPDRRTWPSGGTQSSQLERALPFLLWTILQCAVRPSKLLALHTCKHVFRYTWGASRPALPGPLVMPSLLSIDRSQRFCGLQVIIYKACGSSTCKVENISVLLVSFKQYVVLRGVTNEDIKSLMPCSYDAMFTPELQKKKVEKLNLCSSTGVLLQRPAKHFPTALPWDQFAKSGCFAFAELRAFFLLLSAFQFGLRSNHLLGITVRTAQVPLGFSLYLS